MNGTNASIVTSFSAIDCMCMYIYVCVRVFFIFVLVFDFFSVWNAYVFWFVLCEFVENRSGSEFKLCVMG